CRRPRAGPRRRRDWVTAPTLGPGGSGRRALLALLGGLGRASRRTSHCNSARGFGFGTQLDAYERRSLRLLPNRASAIERTKGPRLRQLAPCRLLGLGVKPQRLVRVVDRLVQ